MARHTIVPHARRGHAALIACAGLAVTALAALAVVTLDEPRAVAVAARVGADAGPGSTGNDPVAPKTAERDAEIDVVKQRRVLAALAQAGLDAEALAAAGVTPQQAAVVAGAVAEEVESLVGDLEAAIATLLAREQQAEALARRLVAGQSDQEQIAQLDAARALLAAARAARDSAEAAVRQAATAELGPELVARLDHQRTTSRHFLPAELRALDRTPAEFAALENAHTHVRVADALGLDPDPAASARLSDARSQPAATAAAGWLNANLAAVSSSLASAAGQ